MPTYTTDFVPSLVGRVFDDRYQIVEFLAEGGMGIVFSGVDATTGRTIAIKILQEQANDPLFRRRFFNEAAMCARVSHPNVVEVIDFGVTDDRVCYIIMELLRGRTLHRALGRETRLQPAQAIHVASQICGGLAVAHELGFIHRDLKPSNIMVVDDTPEGPTVKVLDFGLAKRIREDSGLTQTGTFLGSPSYMSPEQISGQPVTPSTDVYNVGLILYRMLTGVNPFREDVVSATLLAQATRPPPAFADVAPGVAEMAGLEWVVRRCLEKAPDERFRDVGELQKAMDIVKQTLEGKRAAAELSLVGGRVEEVEPKQTRSMLPVVLGVGALAALGGLVAMAVVVAFLFAG